MRLNAPLKKVEAKVRASGCQLCRRVLMVEKAEGLVRASGCQLCRRVLKAEGKFEEASPAETSRGALAVTAYEGRNDGIVDAVKTPRRRLKDMSAFIKQEVLLSYQPIDWSTFDR